MNKIESVKGVNYTPLSRTPIQGTLSPLLVTTPGQTGQIKSVALLHLEKVKVCKKSVSYSLVHPLLLRAV